MKSKCKIWLVLNTSPNISNMCWKFGTEKSRFKTLQFVFLKSNNVQTMSEQCPNHPSILLQILDGYKLFWTGTNCFVWVQLVLDEVASFWPGSKSNQTFLDYFFFNFDLIKMNWTCPKRFLIDKNNLDRQKNFGIRERQGII